MGFSLTSVKEHRPEVFIQLFVVYWLFNGYGRILGFGDTLGVVGCNVLKGTGGKLGVVVS